MRTPLLPLILPLALLTGCRYTFIPLVPPKVTGTFPVRLGATVTRDGDNLVMTATLNDATARGYLSAIWFRDTVELGRDSSYLNAPGQKATFRVSAPERGSGYRIVLSFEGEVLRQLEYNDPAQ